MTRTKGAGKGKAGAAKAAKVRAAALAPDAGWFVQCGDTTLPRAEDEALRRRAAEQFDALLDVAAHMEVQVADALSRRAPGQEDSPGLAACRRALARLARVSRRGRE